MDAMDILGALLGKKMNAPSRGGDTLKDMMAGQRRQPAPRNAPRRPPVPPRNSRPKSIGDAARDLEELLNVSHDHHAQRRPQSVPPRAPQRAPQRQPPPAAEREQLNEQAKVLVRAMVNAAKSDGQITENEQQEILKQLDHVGQSEIEFLRQEFSSPLDVREFAWSVPLGMEEQVYQMSVIAIDLDEHKEAQYLADLAHGLRLDPSRCNRMHERLGAPVIFQE